MDWSTRTITRTPKAVGQLTRLFSTMMLAVALLLSSLAQAEYQIIISEQSEAFPVSPNSNVGVLDNINSLTDRPDISANGQYIGLEIDLLGSSETNDAAVVIDLMTGSRTVIAREGITTVPGSLLGFINSQVEVNNTGQAVFSADTDLTTPPAPGDEIVSFWDGSTLNHYVIEGDIAPAGAPNSVYGTQYDDVQLTNAGDIGGDFDTTGPNALDDFLAVGSTLLLSSNTDPLDGFVVQSGSGRHEVFTEFDVSANGTSYIAEIRTDDDSAFDTYVAVDGVLTVQEGITSHTTPGGRPVVYDGATDSDVADGGHWILDAFSGDSIDYTLVNGVAKLAEGEIAPDGSILSSMSGVSINSNGDYISLWNLSLIHI